MRNRDEFDVSKMPLTPAERAKQQEDAEREAMYARLRARHEAVAAAAQRAAGSPQGDEFIRRGLDAAERAVEYYAQNGSEYRNVIDERGIREPVKFGGVTVRKGSDGDVEDSWKFLQVRVLVNGEVTKHTYGVPDAGLEFPVHEGYVIVFETTFPALREALRSLFSQHGYERTTYVSTSMPSAWPEKLAYALPTRHL